MMSNDLQWIVGAAFALVGLIGGVIARDRQLSKMITEGDDKLHERVNRVRDEFVRRDDLDNHIHRLDKSIDQLSKDIRDQSAETTKRLDALIAVMSKN